jgi:pimeloyl-ACP methyl ester carboxylesterase
VIGDKQGEKIIDTSVIADLIFSFCGESLILDSEARSSAPGKFIELPDGIVHYEMAGPSNGQTVILVHGFSTPYHTWDATFDALIEAGFRVLRYDLYGRGYSDRPDTTYDADLYDRQLWNLLAALNVDDPVDLIGFSMGGAIIVIFADRHPAKVRKLGLIDTAGFPPKKTFAARLLQVPVVGELLMCLNRRPENYPERTHTQMRYKGFRRALLSTVRHGPVGDLAETYRRVGEQKKPVLLIWGREDQALPFETHKRVEETIPHLDFYAIDEAGHGPHSERPELVNPLLIEFLRR